MMTANFPRYVSDLSTLLHRVNTGPRPRRCQFIEGDDFCGIRAEMGPIVESGTEIRAKRLGRA